MAAILGLDTDTVRTACEAAAQGQVVSPANLNGDNQVVIAGHCEAVERAGVLAKERGARRVVPLSVSAPFHCALMQPAADRLREVLSSVPISPLMMPVISNVEARAYTDAAAVKDLLVRQVVSPVRWDESVKELARLGCTAGVEVGPGKVLSGLVKRIAPAIRCVGGDDLEAVRALVQAA
jgi:[acyl-carrier-protein] S-malonyltransferase